MLKVFLTVDTEVWPLFPEWREDRLARDIDRDIYGATPRGAYGLSYQLDLLNHHALKGVFFVEPLFAAVAGQDRLRRILDEVRAKGHEVQLHLHPEWLAWMDAPFLPASAQYLKDFSEADQVTLIARGLQVLRACGAEGICAFRAGDYAANFHTLRALARNGLTYDTSHNTCYLGSRCGLDVPGLVLQPRQIEGICEFPVSFFSDWPGHYRHAQLTACSWPELRTALLQAWRAGWYSFVIVSHSFELLKQRRQNPTCPMPDRIVIRRFERLCRFLAENRDKFRTSGFSELAPGSIPALAPSKALRSLPHHTLGRWLEQLIRRVA
jgi:peptidoglycan/xylan/chitin deacetylase (PgdA/CDA1 family)